MQSYHFAELGLPSRTHSPVVPNRPASLNSLPVARRENFTDDGPLPWLDRPGASEQVEALRRGGAISAQLASMFHYWIEHGYVVLSGFFSGDRLDAAWEAYDRSIHKGVLKPQGEYGARPGEQEKYPGRVLNPHFNVPEIRAILEDAGMVRVMSELLGVKALPFQTIGGHTASQQLPHSDTIHMTTYPLGYLTANWIAFEDIDPDSGPLEYYPGSHKLDYQLSREAGITVEDGRRDYLAYHQRYEPLVQRTIASSGIPASYFHARKGDVLIWHGNLLHGGSRRKNAELSRKAIVCHYFAEGCICYHDYAGNLSHLHAASLQNGSEAETVTRETFDAPAYLAAHDDVRRAGVDPWEHWVRHGKGEGRRLRP